MTAEERMDWIREQLKAEIRRRGTWHPSCIFISREVAIDLQFHESKIGEFCAVAINTGTGDRLEVRELRSRMAVDLSQDEDIRFE